MGQQASQPASASKHSPKGPHPSVRPCIRLLVRSSVHPPVHPSIQASIDPSTRLSARPPVRACVRPRASVQPSSVNCRGRSRTQVGTQHERLHSTILRCSACRTVRNAILCIGAGSARRGQGGRCMGIKQLPDGRYAAFAFLAVCNQQLRPVRSHGTHTCKTLRKPVPSYKA